VISSIPAASKASICHSITDLPEIDKRHLGIFSVNDSNRRPLPALRIIVLMEVSLEVVYETIIT
jgi:hypothetical protein